MKNTDQKLTRQDLWKIFRGQIFIRSALNFERQQCMGFTTAMRPIINKYYETPEERAQAIDRHMQLFLTQPMVSAIPVGVAAAMEERIATEGDLDSSSVNEVKIALMGPLAALGDSLINGTARPIVAGIACSLAQAGSIMGPLLFLAVMAVITVGVRYLGVFEGYRRGVSLVTDMQKSGLIDKIGELASVAAFVVIGGFTPSIVSLALSSGLGYGSGEDFVTIQSALDGMFPCLLPLLLVLGVYTLLRRTKISPVALMLLLMVAGVAGTAVGLF